MEQKQTRVLNNRVLWTYRIMQKESKDRRKERAKGVQVQLRNSLMPLYMYFWSSKLVDIWDNPMPPNLEMFSVVSECYCCLSNIIPPHEFDWPGTFRHPSSPSSRTLGRSSYSSIEEKTYQLLICTLIKADMVQCKCKDLSFSKLHQQDSN